MTSVPGWMHKCILNKFLDQKLDMMADVMMRLNAQCLCFRLDCTDFKCCTALNKRIVDMYCFLFQHRLAEALNVTTAYDFLFSAIKYVANS